MRKFIYPVIALIVAIVSYYTQRSEGASKLEDFKVNTPKTTDFNYLPTSTTGQVIEHAYYSLSYNEKYEQSEWVAYHLKKEHTAYNDFKRPYFEEDPMVKSQSASWKNYKKSGYDKGHLCPAADRRFLKAAHDETFLTSNVTPQKHSFNAGIWNDLEKKIRYKLNKEKDLFIVTGPVIGSSKKTIGFENVAVPNHFFKIILKYTDNGSPRMVGFLIPHDTNSRNLKEFILPVDKIESLVGIDFFPELPDVLEDKLEAKEDKNWIY